MRRFTNALAVGAAVVMGAVSALTAPLVLGQTLQAGAADEYQPCGSPAIDSAIFAATGEHPGQMSGAGLACNPFLYNQGRWNSASELQSHVNEVLNRCGNTASGRLLVLAILEVTGIPPEAGVQNFDNVCHKSVYEQWWDDAEGYESPGVDWTTYVGNAHPSIDVYAAVSGTMSVCHSSAISHAVVSVTDRYPVTDPVGSNPDRFVPAASGLRGQCDPGLYRNGVWSSYGDLKQRVIERAYSTTTCGNAAITQAFRALTSWNSLPSECAAERYGNGSWSSSQELLNRAYHSNRCWEPWLGQFYAYDIAAPRKVVGRGWAMGECSTLLYLGTGKIFLGYDDFRQKVQAVHGALVQQGVEIEADGDVNVGGKEFDGTQVLVGAPGGSAFAGNLAGSTFHNSNGGNVIATGGGNVIATGGGNVIATGGGNVIATGGGNVIATGGGNLIGQAGGN